MADDELPKVPDNFIILDFADGEYEFRLPTLQIAELQDKCRAGVGAIFGRIMAGRYIGPQGDIMLQPVEALFRLEDIRETIRLGLIGGGRGTVDGAPVEVNPIVARKLVERYVDTRPILESWKVAAAVLAAFAIGYDNPRTQKKTPEPQPERTDDAN